jgi:hypothetical protein
MKSTRRLGKRSMKKSRRNSRKLRGGVARIRDIRNTVLFLSEKYGLTELTEDLIYFQALEDQIDSHINALRNYVNIKADTGRDFNEADTNIIESHVESALFLVKDLRVLNPRKIHFRQHILVLRLMCLVR